VVTCFAINGHRILRIHRSRVKQRPVMLSAIEAVTDADPVRKPGRHNSDVAAKATASESVHAASPLKSAIGYFTTIAVGAPQNASAGLEDAKQGIGRKR